MLCSGRLIIFYTFDYALRFRYYDYLGMLGCWLLGDVRYMLYLRCLEGLFVVVVGILLHY